MVLKMAESSEALILKPGWEAWVSGLAHIMASPTPIGCLYEDLYFTDVGGQLWGIERTFPLIKQNLHKIRFCLLSSCYLDLLLSSEAKWKTILIVQQSFLSINNLSALHSEYRNTLCLQQVRYNKSTMIYWFRTIPRVPQRFLWDNFMKMKDSMRRKLPN